MRINTQFLRFASAFYVLFLMWSCQKKESNPAETSNSVGMNSANYVVSSAESQIEWRGYKILKAEHLAHFGFVNVKSGNLFADASTLKGGKMIANLSSITVEDLREDTEAKTKLTAHLKSADFFYVEKFPEATFEISGSEKIESGDFNSILKGKLTIKNQTENVEIPANIFLKDNSIRIFTAPFDINRKDFGLNFSNAVENGVIQDEITLQMIVKAKK